MKKYLILLSALGLFQAATLADHLCTCPKMSKADSSVRGARTIYSTQHMDLAALRESMSSEQSSDMSNSQNSNNDVEFNSETFQGTPGDNVTTETQQSDTQQSDQDKQLEDELDWDD